MIHILSEKNHAFTLVELIVVITILAILSTIGFVSYSSYLTTARDGNRMSQMTKVGDALQVYSTTRSLPIPDDYVTVTASWADNIVFYQGDVWEDVLKTIEFENGWVDPKDNSYYTYMVTKDKSSLQLMTLLEELISVQSSTRVHADNSESRIPKVYGRKLWILTDSQNSPIQRLNLSGATIDIISPGGDYVAHISDEESVNNSEKLWTIAPNSSCKRIKETWWADRSGIYSINPKATGQMDVYCDMGIEWWWWTLYAHSDAWASSWNHSLIMWWEAYQNNQGNFSEIEFTQRMLVKYDGKYEIQKTEIQNSTSIWLTVNAYTLWNAWITWWVSGDGFNGEQWMIFIK